MSSDANSSVPSAPSESKQTCQNCRWWVPGVIVPEESSEGYCHRFPPIRDSVEENDWDEASGYTWSKTDSDDFCGEWTPRKPTPQPPTQPERTEPAANQEFYRPIESPRRYPLELTNELHICLWSEDGKIKWIIAYFLGGTEGFYLHFVGDRPLDFRVNWDHFRELVVQGQKLADERFASSESDERGSRP